MKTILPSLWISLLFAAILAAVPMTPQPLPEAIPDENGHVEFRWLSLPGRTYLVQYSYNLELWAYLNEVFHSGFQIESLTFDPQGERVFLRLQFSDIPTYDAWNDDFNGNGISNEGDVQADTDPLAPVQWDVAVAPDRLGEQLPTELPNHMRWPFTNEAERPKRGDGLFHRDRAVDREQAGLVTSRVLAAQQVHVFLIGGCQKMYEVAVGSSGQIEYVNKSALDGFADVPSWHAFLRGDLTAELGGEFPNPILSDAVMKALMNTIAHEVGHVVVGLGHPDSTNVNVASEAGVAPLARSSFLHQQRVMASGGMSSSGQELVWKEWEKGKSWWNTAFPGGQ